MVHKGRYYLKTSPVPCKFLLVFVPDMSLNFLVSRDSLSLMFKPVKIPPMVR